MAEAVVHTGADFLFVAKADSHKTLYEFLQGGTQEQYSETIRQPGRKHLTYHYRWMQAVPLRDGKDALSVNWIGVTITDAKGKTTYDGAFVNQLASQRRQCGPIGRLRSRPLEDRE